MQLIKGNGYETQQSSLLKNTSEYMKDNRFELWRKI